MRRLSGTALVVLGLLALRPRSGYEIKQTIDKTTRFFWNASYGQIYPELRRLAAAGLVEGEAAPAVRTRADRLRPDRRGTPPSRGVAGRARFPRRHPRRGPAEALLSRLAPGRGCAGAARVRRAAHERI